VSPAEAAVVAAVIYLDGSARAVSPDCDGPACAVEVLVRRAADRGARLVVTPEYALPQEAPEAVPQVGAVPTTPLLARFAATADEIDAYVVVQLLTRAGDARHNSQVALDPDGRVAAVHHKVELYGSENERLTPGDGPTTFDTPFGRVGLLVCADLYADPALHVALRDAGVDVVAVSERWTVAGAPRWPEAFARDWGMAVVSANSASGSAAGGGVYGPSGALGQRHDTGLVVATLPSSSSAGGPAGQ
jgi:predicted amidohydrolase